MAFLTKGLKIVLRDDREEKKREKTFHYEGGIQEFVTYLNRSKTSLYRQIIYCEGEKDGVSVEVAMQHNDSYTENTLRLCKQYQYTGRRNPSCRIQKCTDEDL